jgi:hypothetical protein
VILKSERKPSTLRLGLVAWKESGDLNYFATPTIDGCGRNFHTARVQA